MGAGSIPFMRRSVLAILDCVKDADVWDRIAPDDPHYSSAYYRAWGRNGKLAVGHAMVKPFHEQEPSYIGNAYNYGGAAFDKATTFTAGIWPWAFEQDFDSFRREHKLYERLTTHPWLCNFTETEWLKGTARKKEIAYIDLTKPYKFRQTTRHSIEKADKARVRVEWTEPTIKNTDVFYQMYEAAMTAKNAQPHWHYKDGFFYQILKELGRNRSALFFSKVRGEIESGCIIIFGKNDCYYHWAARKGNYPKLGVDHFQIYSIANWARWKLMKRLTLGGGLTDLADDKLLKFKLGFQNGPKVEVWQVLRA